MLGLLGAQRSGLVVEALQQGNKREDSRTSISILRAGQNSDLWAYSERMEERGPLVSEPVSVTDAVPPVMADVALGAALVAAGATYQAARWGARLGWSLARTGYRAAEAAARWVPPPLAAPVERRVGGVVTSVEEQGRVTREQAPMLLGVAVAVLLDKLVPYAVENALNRIDLNQLIASRVDIDALAALLDLDAAVARVDLDAAVARVDLDAAVARVDLDAAVARVDVDRVVETVNMAVIIEIARQVVDAINLPLIIRESSGGVAADLVTDVRLQTIDADASFARLLDKVFRRGGNPVGPPSAGREPAT
jgi:hypothetical protein